MKSSTLSRVAASSLALSYAFALFAIPLAAKAAGTTAGTVITNTATATYTDSSSKAYTSTSNTVSTTVQNAPSVTFTPGTTQTTVPGGQLTDTFTLTNTGNGSAYFALTAPATTGSDASSQAVAAYLVTLPAAYAGTLPTGCTQIGSTFAYSCTTLGTSAATGAGANVLLYNSTEAAGAVVTVGVVYNVLAGATAGSIAAPNTIISNLSATSTQVAGTGTTLATSTAVPAAETDNVVADARIDVQKYGIQPNTAASGNNPANTTANIEYVLATANGGGVGAHDLQSVKALLGTSANGVFFSDKIPSYTAPGGSAVLAAIQSAAVSTSTTNGFGASSTATIYYTSVANGASGWTAYTSGAFPTTVTYIGVFVSGTPNAEYGTNANGTSPGNVLTTAAAVTLTFYVAPPTGSGSANPYAYYNEANAMNGGGYSNPNPDAAVTNPATDIVAPGVTTGTGDSASATAIDSTGKGVLYPTGAAVAASAATNASNTVGNEAVVTGSVLNGPSGTPGATGSYNGVVANNNNDDFTAVGFTPTGFTPTNGSPTAVAGNSLTTAQTTSVTNTIQNIGNAADNITVVVTAPTGFLAQIYASNGTTLLSSATASSSATATFTNVPSGATTDTTNQVNYIVTYTVPAGANATAFNPYTASLVATSSATGNPTNSTYNVLLLGGPLALVKSVALDTTTGTCPGGNAVPGCIITYSINYVNNANATCQTVPGTIPAYDAAYYVKGLVITENGTAGGNTWGASYTNSTGTHTNTTGLNGTSLPTDTTTGSTFTGNTAGSFSFTDTPGGAAYIIGPGCSGTLTFKVTVSTQ